MILKSFYSLIKSNSKYFRKIFVTGITRFKDVSMLTLGNTISDISLSIDFGTIVGFTRAELKKYFYDHLVMAVTLLQNKSEEKVTNSDIETLLDQLASWYDGYSFDENAQSHVFSTISLINFFSNSNARTKFKNYWYELGGTPTSLVNNCQKIWDSDIDNAFKEDAEFWFSEDAFKNPSSYENMDPKVMLYQTGYLTLAKAIDTDVYLKFPNLEIRSSFAKLQYLYLFKNAEKLITSSFNQELSKLNFETSLEKIEALQQIKEKQYTQIPDRKVKGYALVFDQETKKFVAFKQS